MSKAEVMAGLTQLSPEDLAEVRAWLDHIAPEKSRTNAATAVSPAPHLRSPRLANPAQAADFKKQVTELPANAAL